MKKAVITLSLLACVGSMMSLQSCDKIKEEAKKKANVDLNFDLTGGTATFDIPATSATEVTFVVDTVPVPFNLDAEIRSQTSDLYTIDDLESITVTSAKLKINNPSSTNNFANFNSAVAAFYTDTKSDEIAYIATNDVVPDTYDDEIDLVPSNSNLVAYLRGTTVYYLASVNLRRSTTQVMNSTLTVTYTIKLKEQ